MIVAVTTHLNRTGISANPEEANKSIEGAQQAQPSSPGDSAAMAAVRDPYISGGEPIGSRPPTATPNVPPVLLDLLGERLSFERGGTRLYEALLGKVQAAKRQPGGPSAADVQHIMQEEARHAALVQASIERLGGDPTIETPAADVSGVVSTGLVQILTDPRTTVAQCLKALLTAELTDNDGWQMLIQLAESLGNEELVTEFQEALSTEQEHLAKVRGWLLTLVEKEVRAR
jgi:rubrerythrin